MVRRPPRHRALTISNRRAANRRPRSQGSTPRSSRRRALQARRPFPPSWPRAGMRRSSGGRHASACYRPGGEGEAGPRGGKRQKKPLSETASTPHDRCPGPRFCASIYLNTRRRALQARRPFPPSWPRAGMRRSSGGRHASACYRPGGEGEAGPRGGKRQKKPSQRPPRHPMIGAQAHAFALRFT